MECAFRSNLPLFVFRKMEMSEYHRCPEKGAYYSWNLRKIGWFWILSLDAETLITAKTESFKNFPSPFRFYQLNSNGSKLIRSSHTSENFDVRTLRRYLFYIGLPNLGLPVAKHQRYISGLQLY